MRQNEVKQLRGALARGSQAPAEPQPANGSAGYAGLPASPSRAFIPQHSFRVTREGWCWLMFAAALWGTGLYKGVNLMTLLGTLMLATWGLNTVFAGRRLRRLQLRRW